MSANSCGYQWEDEAYDHEGEDEQCGGQHECILQPGHEPDTPEHECACGDVQEEFYKPLPVKKPTRTTKPKKKR